MTGIRFSVTQQRFWLLTMVAPQNPAFHMSACVRLSGQLSTEGLESSFQLLIDRHETLRTTFDQVNDELTQVIVTRRRFVLEFANLESTPSDLREIELERLLREEARQPFDIRQAPPFRARLFRLQADNHVLCITLHHILADGWSQRILQQELWSAYEAFNTNREPSLPSLPIQYGDFASWQRQWLASNEAREHLNFWRKQLASSLPVLNFPTDRPPSNHPVPQCAIETLLLPAELIRSLRDLCQSENATVFMLTFACFAILLFQYTGQIDVLIGSPVANRNDETDALIGPFSGPLALRLDLSGNPTLCEVLRRASKVTTDALQHSALPFEVVLKEMKVRSIDVRNPLFQFYFLHQTAFLQSRELPQLTITPLPPMAIATPFEIQLAIIERDHGVRANIVYKADLFDGSTIRQVLSQYQSLLQAFITNPHCSIADLEEPALRQGQGQMWASRETSHNYIAPRNDVEIEVAEIWHRVLGISGIGVCDDFFDLGGSSLLAADLVLEMERKFFIKINLSMLLTVRTIEQFAWHLITAREQGSSTLTPIHTPSKTPALFCVPVMGGSLFNYMDMAAIIAKDQPVYGLGMFDPNGLQRQKSVEELAESYAHELRTIQAKGPYRVCGYSFGGLVAYELARRLVNEGEDVSELIIFDTVNPAYYRNLPFAHAIPFWSTYIFGRLKKHGRWLVRGKFTEIVAAISLHWESKLKGPSDRTSPKSEANRLAMRTRFEANDFSLPFYTPKPYSGRLLLIRAGERLPEYKHNPTLGWNQVCSGRIDVRYTPGDHASLMEKPNVRKLVEVLNSYFADNFHHA